MAKAVWKGGTLLLPHDVGCGAPCSAPVAVASTSPSTLAISYPATPSVVTISMHQP